MRFVEMDYANWTPEREQVFGLFYPRIHRRVSTSVICSERLGFATITRAGRDALGMIMENSEGIVEVVRTTAWSRIPRRER